MVQAETVLLVNCSQVLLAPSHHSLESIKVCSCLRKGDALEKLLGSSTLTFMPRKALIAFGVVLRKTKTETAGENVFL